MVYIVSQKRNIKSSSSTTHRAQQPKEMIMDALVARRNKLLVRIPALAGLLVALFWGVWYLVTGNVPSVSVVTFGKEMVYELPFVISRGFDSSAAMVFAVMAVLLWYVVIKTEDSFAVAFAASVFAVVFVFAVAAAVVFVFAAATVATNRAVVAVIAPFAVVAVIAPFAVSVFVFAAVAAAVAATEKTEYKEGLAVCIVLSLVLVFGLSVGMSVVFGGVVGLSIAVALGFAYSIQALFLLIFNWILYSVLL